jgi:hypothetical protein
VSARGADPERLEALIRNAGIAFRTNAKSFIFTCPLCDKADRLWMYRATGRFKCYHCATSKGFRGAPEFALKELTGRKIEDLRKELYGDEVVPAGYFLGFDFNDYGEEDDTVEDISFTPMEWDANCKPLDHPHSARGVAYLEKKRGIPLSVAMQYRIRYNPVERAVAFPVYVDGVLVGWQYRVVYDPKPNQLKVWTEGENFRENAVMFAERLLDCSHAVLCEGPVDALKAHLVGGNVASMGKEVSNGQIRMLLNAGVRKLYLALDPDAAGAIDPLLERFEGASVHLVKLPPGYKDIGEMTMEAARDAILSSGPIHRGMMFNSYWK